MLHQTVTLGSNPSNVFKCVLLIGADMKCCEKLSEIFLMKCNFCKFAIILYKLHSTADELLGIFKIAFSQKMLDNFCICQ